MGIVKIPKKLKDICGIIRSGNISEGLLALDKFDKLEVQKNAILAEVAYFSYDFIKAVKYDKSVFPYWGQWYSGNIFQEHLAAFTFASLQNNTCNDAVSFYKSFLKSKLNDNDLEPHQRKYFKVSITQNIDILTNGLADYSNENGFKQKDKNKSMPEFVIQLKKYRPKLQEDSVEAADYMLNFIYSDGSPQDFIELYEKISENQNINSEHHICAAKIYLSLNDDEKARQAICNYVRYGWSAVEHTQVMPLNLFFEYSLYRLLTKEFLMELMIIPKEHY